MTWTDGIVRDVAIPNEARVVCNYNGAGRIHLLNIGRRLVRDVCSEEVRW